MRFLIEHTKHYTYTEPVFLEPHLIRMCPRSDWSQTCREYKLTITPEPAGITRNLDAHGNQVEEAWFDGLTPELVVRGRSVVETHPRNPFGYILPAYAGTIPFTYPETDLAALKPYLGSAEPASPGVINMARACVEEASGETLHFASRLSDHIYHRIKYTHRPEGEPYRPEETLECAEGACRDVAVLYMACARAMGLAARFVTGYHDPEERDPELHAWAEVYIPGGGWRGYDPSDGLAVGEHHIALAASADPACAHTLTGSSRGSATHTLETSVLIKAE